MPASLNIELFGGLRVVSLGHQALEMPLQHSSALLAYLALHLDKQHPREKLADLFWPEEQPETARHRLRHTLHLLRRQLEQRPSFNQTTTFRNSI